MQATTTWLTPRPVRRPNIAARDLHVTATGVDKDYDGTTSATVTLSTDKISGDIVTASYTTASFADKNVGSGKTVSADWDLDQRCRCWQLQPV